jgi:hypothetical protein
MAQGPIGRRLRAGGILVTHTRYGTSSNVSSAVRVNTGVFIAYQSVVDLQIFENVHQIFGR